MRIFRSRFCVSDERFACGQRHDIYRMRRTPYRTSLPSSYAVKSYRHERTNITYVGARLSSTWKKTCMSKRRTVFRSGFSPLVACAMWFSMLWYLFSAFIWLFDAPSSYVSVMRCHGKLESVWRIFQRSKARNIFAFRFVMHTQNRRSFAFYFHLFLYWLE